MTDEKEFKQMEKDFEIERLEDDDFSGWEELASLLCVCLLVFLGGATAILILNWVLSLCRTRWPHL